MDHPRAVRRDERFGSLDRVPDGGVRAHRTAFGDDPLQIEAVHVVHRDPGHLLVLAGTAHAHDPRVVDDGERARLAHQPHARRVGGDPRRHHLDHDARAVRVASEEQHAHAALRQPALDHVGADGGTRGNEGGGGGHGFSSILRSLATSRYS